MEMSELNKMDVAKLLELVEGKRKEMLQLRISRAIGQLEKTHRFRELRKDVARIQTVLSARKRAA